MTTVDDDLTDLLPDDLLPDTPKQVRPVPLKRTPKQIAAAEKRAAAAEQAKQLALAQTAAQTQAATLAQIVNLHIAGHSLAAIGAAIGATEAEVDRMLSNETARYVKNQPALRTYVRNYISSKYDALLGAVWDEAVNKNSAAQLEHVDRAQRILAQMGRLHGAEAPTQTEVKVESSPEAVERLVQVLASAQGMGYDTDVFGGGDDIVDGEVLEELHEQTSTALEVSRNQVEESDGHDSL